MLLYRLFPHYLGTFEVVTYVGTLKQEASTVYKDWRIASYKIENCRINWETKDERYQEVGRRLEGAQLWKKVEHPLLTTLKHFFDHTFVIRI